jgi:23S rRNA pseudouridine1911/1915/1917 synthase
MTIHHKDILFEDNHLLIINKKAGILVQGDDTGDLSLLDFAKEYIKKKYGKPGNVYIGLPHRIDRPVSGVVILCKTSKSLSRVAQAFNSKQIKKTYWAVVSKKPSKTSGTLVHWLQKNKESNKVKVATKEFPDSLRSELDYKIISEANGFYLLEIHPLTGRSHQIRAQLSEFKIPISGDYKYGDRNLSEDNSIHLHARSVEFLHPVREKALKITAPLPQSGLWKLFKKLEVI